MPERKRDYKQKDYSADYGKVPPQAVDLEEAVLSALLLESDAYSLVGDMLEPETFYKKSHQKIFHAIRELFVQDRPVDLLTVTDYLQSTGELDEVGGLAYLSSLSSKVASAANVEFHVKILVQKYLKRQMITSCTELQNMAYDDSVDVQDLIDRAQKRVFDMTDTNIRKDTQEASPLLTQALANIKKASENVTGINGISSGFTELDKNTHGWQPSDLVIIAARPAMGKTAFVLSMAKNIAVDQKIPLAIFSLEMSGVQLMYRMLSCQAELESEKLKTGQLTEQEWIHLNNSAKVLSNSPIYIDDTAGLSILELRSKCRMLQNKYKIKMVIVDYLQLMTAGADMRGNREQEVSMISRQLKIIAKELGITMIALSQLNRGLESRQDKKPILSDLRESGSIEQDADMVIFIHRPEVYNKSGVDGNGLSQKGLAEIIIAKHRSGSIGEIKLRFRGQYTQFVDWDTISRSKAKPRKSAISEADAVELNDSINISNSVMSADTEMFDKSPKADDDDPPF
ncbi:MAG: replicative DNA helicase [Odoribacter sp.]|nr:replicative DNA helicase [Odoribacter sp.]